MPPTKQEFCDALLGDNGSMDGPPSLWKQKGGITQTFTVDEIRAYEEVLLQARAYIQY